VGRNRDGVRKGWVGRACDVGVRDVIRSCEGARVSYVTPACVPCWLERPWSSRPSPATSRLSELPPISLNTSPIPQLLSFGPVRAPSALHLAPSTPRRERESFTRLTCIIGWSVCNELEGAPCQLQVHS
jgi:hypothetical protein